MHFSLFEDSFIWDILLSAYYMPGSVLNTDRVVNDMDTILTFKIKYLNEVKK